MTLRIRHLTEGQFPTAEEAALTRSYHDAMARLCIDADALAEKWGGSDIVEQVLAGRAFIVTDEPVHEATAFNRNDALTALGVDADMQGYI